MRTKHPLKFTVINGIVRLCVFCMMCCVCQSCYFGKYYLRTAQGDAYGNTEPVVIVLRACHKGEVVIADTTQYDFHYKIVGPHRYRRLTKSLLLEFDDSVSFEEKAFKLDYNCTLRYEDGDSLINFRKNRPPLDEDVDSFLDNILNEMKN